MRWLTRAQKPFITLVKLFNMCLSAIRSIGDPIHRITLSIFGWYKLLLLSVI